MSPPERETEEHAARGLLDREMLCGSVLLEGSFLVELPAVGEVLIGREADVDLQLDSASVSRRHARLEMRGDHGTLSDLGSRNGTFVNGERLEKGPRRVARGDEISFGSARMALFGRAMIPAGSRAVLVRSALLRRLAAEIAERASVQVLAIRTRQPWYTLDELGRWLARLPAGAYVGVLSIQALVVIAGDPPGEISTLELTRGGVEVDLGRSHSDPEMARSAEDLITAALRDFTASRRHDRPRRAPSPASEAMRAMREEAAKIAPSHVSVLLVGETGVGKEVLARFIHERSGRPGPLVSVNTAALPESLVESELFGHERGAFSGAHQAKAGLVEAAGGGTLFLDEIGDLPLGLQAKLLRVLEERAVRRVGATQERKVDVRVVAATHRDLDRAVAEGTFRMDLLFRLNACTLRIPPLRERVAEIEPLARELLGDLPAGAALTLSPEAAALLRRHPWPGNVRELRNVIERGAALASGGKALLPEHLPEQLRSPRAPLEREAPGSAEGLPASAGDVRDALKDYERQRIVDALDMAGGNQSRAAKTLGLPRRTLAYKMARLGIRGA